jgi:Holliday junction DNA helicase RuvA
MLAYLSGTVKERQNGEMILVVGAESQGFVGYQVKTPDHPRYEVYIPGHSAEVYVYTHVREDALDLYGFLSASEKNFYTTVLSVSGVGPKLALALLSHADELSLIQMILEGDKESLTSISGVGKKTAERMILELKDTLQKKIDLGIFSLRGANSKKTAMGAGATSGSIDRSSKLFMEAYLALQGLGYKEVQAKLMVEEAFKNKSALTKVEDVIKQALQAGFNL